MRFRTVAASAALLLAASPLLGAGAIPGLRSSGTIVVVANVQGEPINVGGKVALYHKGSLYRLDLLSLGFPGVSGDLSQIAASLIGPGGVSLVYDGATGAVSAWSTTNHTFYSAAPSRPAPGAAPAPAGPAAEGSGDPLAALANVAAALKDVQSANIQLTGHSTVNGHPTTDLDVQMKRQLPGKPLENYHVQLALADDLGDFPVQIAFQSIPATKSAFGGTMKLDLTTVQRDTPDDGIFAIPQGYTRVSTLGAVLKPTGR
jgi:hypothetical protein